MHDGWTYVLAAYAVSAAIFVVWFWMILTKLRKHSPKRTAQQERARG